MSEEKLKKQVVYPEFLTRLILGLIDIIIFIYIIDGLLNILQYANLYIFKTLFSDFIAQNKLSPNVDNLNNILLSKDMLMSDDHYLKWKYTLYIILFEFLLIGIYVILTWRFLGQTPLKRLFKMQICTTKFKKCSTATLLLRYISLITVPVSFVVTLFSRNQRSIHDIISSTIVISDSENLITD